MRKKEISNKWAFIFLVLFSFCGFAHANKIIYVEDDAAGANDGSSWQNAYIYLQDALADANSSEKPLEIRVAQGTYKPDQGNGQTAGDRDAAFNLISGVILTGGYAGIFEPDPNEQDYQIFKTILSGDLNSNDIEVKDPNDLADELTRKDNSYCVITTYRTDNVCILDGFTITAGSGYIYRNGSSFGGGIHIDSGKLQIRNCSFINNFGASGAGIRVNNGQITLINCIFENNIASEIGGGIYSIGSKINLKNCIFKDNSASYGGAMSLSLSLEGSSFNNSLFIRNSATNKGGAVYMGSNHYPMEIINFTFAGNSALRGKSIFSYCDLKISNSILYNGGQDEIWHDYNYALKTEVCYSNIQNGKSAIYNPNGQIVWGDGNIDTDPLFADPNNGDYHLKSQAGRWNPYSESWVQDDVTSPCIDAGDPNSPIGIEPFPNGGYINMGAYGGTVEASKSYFGKPVCQTIVAGDINGDCKVDELDMAIMMIHWLEDHNPTDVKIIEGLEFRIKTDKTFYKQGENVQMDFTVTNLTNETVHISCYQSRKFNLLVQKDGTEIWTLSQVFQPHFSVVELSAGETKGISHSWDMKNNDGYLVVDPGTYTIVGEMFNYDFGPETVGPTEVKTSITIAASTGP